MQYLEIVVATFGFPKIFCSKRNKKKILKWLIPYWVPPLIGKKREFKEQNH